jgi:uncharacterized membrane protein YfcA
LYLFFGDRIVPAGLAAGALIPLLLVVTYCGLHVGTRLGRHRLRRVTLALLLLMGLSGLAAPLMTRKVGKEPSVDPGSTHMEPNR